MGPCDLDPPTPGRTNLSYRGPTLADMRETDITRDITTEVTTPITARDPYHDPVTYLAEHGIESELIAVVETPLPRAA